MKNNGCPIEGVSKDCERCDGMGWGYCVYVKVWEIRGRPSKISPYITLNMTPNCNKKSEKEK